MKQLFSRKLGKLIAVATAASAILLAAADQPASALTQADADTSVNAYLQAFVRSDGTSAFIKGDQNGGDPGFWQEIEEIEGIEDANDRTGGAYKSQVAALLNGFSKAHGTNWSDNIYNDDISWATIAYTRGYQTTGNTTFRTIAKNNFDLMFARAWNPAKGALYWTTNNTSYNSCIECPAGIASYLLSKALKDATYLTKAQDLFAWEKANLFRPSSGAIWDAVDTSGKVGTWSSTYNQGTFIGLANYLGDTTSAVLAANYIRYHLGKHTTNEHLIMPEYGAGGNNKRRLEFHRPALDRKVHEGSPSSEYLFKLAAGQCRHRLEYPTDLRQSLLVSVASANPQRRPALRGTVSTPSWRCR